MRDPGAYGLPLAAQAEFVVRLCGGDERIDAAHREGGKAITAKTVRMARRSAPRAQHTSGTRAALTIRGA